MKFINGVCVIILFCIMGYSIFIDRPVETSILIVVSIILIWVAQIADDVGKILELKKKEGKDGK